MSRAGFSLCSKLALAGFLALAVAGCSPSGGELSTRGLPGEMVLNRGNGAEPKTVDPHYVDSIWETWIVGDLLMGLTTEDSAGRAIPGAAQSWDVSPDGLTWAFHIRDHLWSDGVPVTSQDFLFAWRRLFDPKTGAGYAYNLWVLKNSEPITAGKMPVEALGVSAPDDKTLVVHLEHPAAYLPELLTHDTARPLPRHQMLAKGDAWDKVGNYVSNGAYVLDAWVPNDHITLLKNKKFYDAANVRIDRVNFYPTVDTGAALKWMRAGLIDTLDPFGTTQIGWLRIHMPETISLKPSLSTYYIVFNLAHKPYDDIRIREAINLTLNREALTNDVLRLGEPAAYGIVPPGIANYPGDASMAMKSMPNVDRIARAQALMRAAGYGPDRHFHTTFATGTDPDWKRIAAAVQDMLRSAYIDAEIVQSDLQIHYKKLQLGDFDMAWSGWIADFNDATNFLDLLRCDSGNNYGKYCNRAYDALLDKANLEPDAAKRGNMLRDAENLVLKDFPWAPARFADNRELVQPYVKGWINNGRDINRTRWLWIDKGVLVASAK